MIEKDIIAKLDMIAEDMRKDAEHFDGKPFTGKTVAEYFGYQGAAISALAKFMKEIIKNKQEGSK